jgi:hypothetical protein
VIIRFWAKILCLYPVTSQDLLQPLAFQAACGGGMSHISLVALKQVCEVFSVETVQCPRLGFLVWYMLDLFN